MEGACRPKWRILVTHLRGGLGEAAEADILLRPKTPYLQNQMSPTATCHGPKPVFFLF